MARKCGPSRWKRSVFETRRENHLRETRRTRRMFMRAFDASFQVSTGWPAFAGHDNVIVFVDDMKVRTTETHIRADFSEYMRKLPKDLAEGTTPTYSQL